MEQLTILLVDDNKRLAEFMKKMISNNNKYRVIGITNDGEEEIKMIKDLKPDVVITDLKRKKTWDGLNIIKEMKNKDIIFFVVSASAYNFINELKELNVKYLLNKPYKDECFLEILNRIYEDKYNSHLIKIDHQIGSNTSLLKKFFEKLKRRIGK